MSEETIFAAAIERNDPADRAVYLDSACRGDVALRHRVEALLQAHSAADPLLDLPPALHDATDDIPGLGSALATDSRSRAADSRATITEAGDPSDATSQGGRLVGQGHVRPVIEGPGTRIGPYKLLQKIGEGRMGVVYMAEQDQPVRRRVALKIIKPGMDTGQVVARFEAERQALALMDHPNIAKVFDAGVTDSGRPFFVMELIKGVPITEYCDQAQLNPRERLELFVPVCQAIQHAHQKGVIHRDVKPTNVLVTLFDDKPVPKVIDFGMAKATAQRLTERTLFTGFGAIVGTLEYMSPEQSAIAGQDVDTRSDVYSLGVLLYELLTGTTPLERVKLRSAAYAEILQRIKEEEPPSPSIRLSESRETLASVAASRKTDPARLSRLVRGELDWIVMRALEKDRNRRYETASGFARDVQRYLADEAVEACPPSVSYRLRKFARKNRALLATACGFAGMLALGAGLSTWQAIRATQAERAAVRAEATIRLERDRALKAEGQATDSAKKAQTEAAIAKAVSDFLQNDLLAEAAPDKNARDKQVTVEALLKKAAATIAGKFAGQPEVEAAIRHTIGDAYWMLGLYPESQPHVERSLELRRRLLGPEHPETLNAMDTLAMFYTNRAQFEEAETLYAQGLEVSRRVLGPEHRDTLFKMHNLAMRDKARGRFDKAEPRFIQTLEVMRRVLGPEHPNTLTAMNNLAEFYQDRGQFEKAEPLYRENLAAQKRLDRDQHPAVAGTLASLGLNLINQKKWTDAESSLRECLKIRERVQPEQWSTFNARSLLGGSLLGQKKYAEAEPLLLSGFEGMKAREAEVPPQSKVRLPEAVGRIIQFYEALGRADETALWRAKRKALAETPGDKTPAKELPDDPFAR